MEEREIKSRKDLQSHITHAITQNVHWFVTFALSLAAGILFAFVLFIACYLGLVANGNYNDTVKEMSLVFSHLSGWIVSIVLVIKDYYKEKNRTL